MKVFKELEIKVPKQRSAEFLSEVESQLSDGWNRDKAAEERSRNSGFPGSSEHYYFSCDKQEHREAATLALVWKEDGALHVSNIIPAELHRLDKGQYNQILGDFYSHFIQPASTALGISCSLSSDEEALENWISPESARLLRLFSNAANKSTGSVHPMDQERWNDFLLGIFHKGEKLEAHQLQRWLVEEESWHPDVAGDLAEEYEFAMGLLKQQESRQAS